MKEAMQQLLDKAARAIHAAEALLNERRRRFRPG
jgi:hypothetical protein